MKYLEKYEKQRFRYYIVVINMSVIILKNVFQFSIRRYFLLQKELYISFEGNLQSTLCAVKEEKKLTSRFCCGKYTRSFQNERKYVSLLQITTIIIKKK